MLTGPPTKRHPQKRRLQLIPKAPTTRREQQGTSTTQSSGSETETSSVHNALSTSVSSWDEPPPKRARRLRPARWREVAAAIPPSRRLGGVKNTATRPPDTGAVDRAQRRRRQCRSSQRKPGIPRKYLFPYDLVERGDKGKVLKKWEATQEEYVLGLKRMEAQQRFSAQALPARSRHQETVAQDNCSIPWEIVRRYSEETFTWIADADADAPPPAGSHVASRRGNPVTSVAGFPSRPIAARNMGGRPSGLICISAWSALKLGPAGYAN